jgi:hypothetical protein
MSPHSGVGGCTPSPRKLRLAEKMLEEAGVVTRVIEGRTHRLALQPQTLADAAGWLERQRTRWEGLFDAVGEYLEEER